MRVLYQFWGLAHEVLPIFITVIFWVIKTKIFWAIAVYNALKITVAPQPFQFWKTLGRKLFCPQEEKRNYKLKNRAQTVYSRVMHGYIRLCFSILQHDWWGKPNPAKFFNALILLDSKIIFGRVKYNENNFFFSSFFVWNFAAEKLWVDFVQVFTKDMFIILQ